VSQVREAGRNTQGVRILRVSEGERVVAVEPVAEDDGPVQELPPIVDSLLPAASPAEGGEGPTEA
jgi:hypothetical protein